MKYKTNISLIITLLCFNICIGQNLTTENGNKIGKWQEEFVNTKGSYKAIGNYQVLAIDSLGSIDFVFNNHIRVKKLASTPLVYYTTYRNNKISVKDGIWKTYYSSGKIAQIDSFKDGLNYWEKHFDTSGILNELNYNDFEGDTEVYLTYLDKQLFKKAYYPPNDKNNQTINYYPYNNLFIENAEPDLHKNFTLKRDSIYQIKLSAKMNMQILSIKSSSSNIKFKELQEKLPITLKPNDTIKIKFTFNPIPTSLREKDTITITTSEKNSPTYNIFCSTTAAHFDWENIGRLYYLKLSKEKDKYLILSPLGTSTGASIYQNEGEERKYSVQDITKINLNDFKVGKYNLRIHSCGILEIIQLDIIK